MTNPYPPRKRARQNRHLSVFSCWSMMRRMYRNHLSSRNGIVGFVLDDSLDLLFFLDFHPSNKFPAEFTPKNTTVFLVEVFFEGTANTIQPLSTQIGLFFTLTGDLSAVRAEKPGFFHPSDRWKQLAPPPKTKECKWLENTTMNEKMCIDFLLKMVNFTALSC